MHISVNLRRALALVGLEELLDVISVLCGSEALGGIGHQPGECEGAARAELLEKSVPASKFAD